MAINTNGLSEETAKLVLTIADNQPRIKEEGKAVGRKEEHDAIYEDITITQDCTNAYDLMQTFSALVSADDKLVIFINKKWVAYPTEDTDDNTVLSAMVYNNEYKLSETRCGLIIRWRGGTENAVMNIIPDYDVIVSAGDVFRKVVLR